jgi:hypothetical protein
VEPLLEGADVNLTHPQWVRFSEIFGEHLTRFEPDRMDVESIQQLCQLMWLQSTPERPRLRSDSIGCAFSSLTLLEAIYDRILRAARTEFLAETGGVVGADTGAGDDSGGGTRSE